MRRAAALLLAVLVLLCACAPAAEAKAAQAAGILVVYRRDGTASAEAQSKEVVRQVLFAGRPCDAVPQSAYTAGLADRYDGVVVVGPAEGQLLRDLAAYRGKLCWVGPGLSGLSGRWAAAYAGKTGARPLQFLFGGARKTLSPGGAPAAELYAPGKGAGILGTVSGEPAGGAFSFSQGSLTYFGITEGIDSDPRLQTALEYALAAFLGRQPGAAGVCLSLDYLYPVSDFQSVAAMGQYLQQKNLPFTFTVMPFYANAGTAQAREYGNLLRYLAACGGTPVLHVPVFQPLSAGSVPVFSKMQGLLETALKNYVSLGVYPSALQMPEETFFYSGCAGFLTQTGDLFSVSGDGKDVYTVGAETVSAFLPAAKTSYPAGAAVTRELRAPSEEKNFGDFFDRAAFVSGDAYGKWRISLPCDLPLSRFRSLVDGIAAREIPVRDFGTETHSLRIGKQTVAVSGGAVAFNGAAVPSAGLSYEESSPAPSASSGGAEGKGAGPAALFLAAGIGVVLFLLAAVLVSLRKNRQKFLQKR